MLDPIDPRAVLKLVDEIKPMLEGRGPKVQGAALACLLSLWLAGHPKEIREKLITAHLDSVRELVPIDAAELGTEP
jgi:hypothetical protein